jgi:flavin-dependent dehydrogenase
LTEASNTQVIVVGGGLAGLCASIHLASQQIDVLLIEKQQFPRHKVCGEYISNEVLPYLNFLGFDPFAHGAKRITEFELTTRSNKKISARLPLGGFGMSRYKMDHQLYKRALEVGVKSLTDQVLAINFQEPGFEVLTKNSGTHRSQLVIGAFGKRSNLDVEMQRSFIKQKSPYLGVKMHVAGAFPEQKVALHNFKGGYCGVSKVENDHINLCYITSFKAFKEFRDIRSFQEQVVCRNRELKRLFAETSPQFEAPLSISQISFRTKAPVENHILMCGDSAGMIHPLCGNGMGMAIRSAQLASLCIIDYIQGKIPTRTKMEQAYYNKWQSNFKLRLKVGHSIAFLFRQQKVATIMLYLLRVFPFLVPQIIKLTHGKPMTVR